MAYSEYNQHVYDAGFSSGYNWKTCKRKTLPNRPYINNHVEGEVLRIWRNGFYDGLLKSYNLGQGEIMNNYPNKRLSAMTEVMALQIVLDLAKEHLSCQDSTGYSISLDNREEEDKNLKAIEMIEEMIVNLQRGEK